MWIPYLTWTLLIDVRGYTYMCTYLENTNLSRRIMDKLHVLLFLHVWCGVCGFLVLLFWIICKLKMAAIWYYNIMTVRYSKLTKLAVSSEEAPPDVSIVLQRHSQDIYHPELTFSTYWHIILQERNLHIYLFLYW